MTEGGKFYLQTLECCLICDLELPFNKLHRFLAPGSPGSQNVSYLNAHVKWYTLKVRFSKPEVINNAFEHDAGVTSSPHTLGVECRCVLSIRV